MKTASNITKARKAPALAVGLIASLVSALTLSVAPAQVTPPVRTEAAPSSAAIDFLPESFNPQEHASTWSNPPFSRKVLPDKGPEAPPAGPPIWDGWQIASYDSFRGQKSVGLVSKKNKFHLIREGETKEDDAGEVTVTKIESDGRIANTIVHLSGGGQTGTLTFDVKRLAQAPRGQPTAPAATARAAPRRASTPPQQNLNPQQQARAAAARAAAQQQAKQEMANHLNAAIQPAAGAAANPTPRPQAATPTPAPRTAPTRTKRRSVVLPPSSNNR